MDDSLPDDMRNRGLRDTEEPIEKLEVPGLPVRERREVHEPAFAPPPRPGGSSMWWKLVYWTVAILLSSGLTLYLMQTGNLVFLFPGLFVLAILVYFALKSE